MLKLAGRGGVSREFGSREEWPGTGQGKFTVEAAFMGFVCLKGMPKAGETKPLNGAICPDCQLCFIEKKHGNEDVHLATVLKPVP